MTEPLQPNNLCGNCGESIGAVTKCPYCGHGGLGFLIPKILLWVGIPLVAIPIILVLVLGIGSSKKPFDSCVKGNMRTAQIAAESYASDNGGVFPTEIDTAFKSYYPGGSNNGKIAGSPPVNPATKQPEWPILGHVTDITAERKLPPQPLPAGVIEYTPLFDAQHKPDSYAIRGGGEKNLSVTGSGGTQLVLSNQ